MKTIQEYLNDPRILNDPQMAGALEPVKEIHAARLMIQDETAGMSMTEKAVYHKQEATALFSSLGLSSPRYINLSGRGKMRSKPAAEM